MLRADARCLEKIHATRLAKENSYGLARAFIARPRPAGIKRPFSVDGAFMHGESSYGLARAYRTATPCRY